MKLVKFELSGRLGHFLYAEANRDLPTYPIPPRTAILGLIGAILGISKDKPQELLEPCNIAVKGYLPEKFWVKTKFHKSIKSINSIVKAKTKGSSGDQKIPKILFQELLFNPTYTIWVNLPDEYHVELSERVKHRKWYFQPSLGISEFMADIKWLGDFVGNKQEYGLHEISTVFPKDDCELNMDIIFEKELALHSIRMPYHVTTDRVFRHRQYYFERDSKRVPIYSDSVIKASEDKIMFL